MNTPKKRRGTRPDWPMLFGSQNTSKPRATHKPSHHKPSPDRKGAGSADNTIETIHKLMTKVQDLQNRMDAAESDIDRLITLENACLDKLDETNLSKDETKMHQDETKGH